MSSRYYTIYDMYKVTWGIASPVEYDVPKCSEGVMGCSRESDGSWTLAANHSQDYTK